MKSSDIESRSVLSGTGAERVRRRRYFIDKKFQAAFAANMLLIAGVCMGVAALAVTWFFAYFMNSRLSCELDAAYMMKIGIILLFIMAGIVLWTVMRTHALVGPIYKTRKILQAAAEGRFPDRPVQFRRGDAFKGLAADLNRCLETMQADRERLELLGGSDEEIPRAFQE